MSRSRMTLTALSWVVLLNLTIAPVVADGTLWRFLGIPQTAAWLRNSTVNRRGNTPGLERVPPPKKIADPENLESDSEAVRKAAEIKQAEDEKEQKIKALKYLATVGCGCYEGVAEAFMSALEDCTEEVRYEAAKAIQEAAGNTCCGCNQNGCCSEDLVKKLAERAYERDENGCYIEPSSRVREELEKALRKCCRGSAPIEIVDPNTPEPIVPPPDPSPSDPPSDDSVGEELPTNVTSVTRQNSSLVRFKSGQSPIPGGNPGVNHFQQSLPPAVKWVRGTVSQISSNGSRVEINYQDSLTASHGSRAMVFHDFLLGQEKVAELQVVESYPGVAVATPNGPARRMAVGDTVKLLVYDPARPISKESSDSTGDGNLADDEVRSEEEETWKPKRALEPVCIADSNQDSVRQLETEGANDIFDNVLGATSNVNVGATESEVMDSELQQLPPVLPLEQNEKEFESQSDSEAEDNIFLEVLGNEVELGEAHDSHAQSGTTDQESEQNSQTPVPFGEETTDKPEEFTPQDLDALFSKMQGGSNRRDSVQGTTTQTIVQTVSRDTGNSESVRASLSTPVPTQTLDRSLKRTGANVPEKSVQPKKRSTKYGRIKLFSRNR